MKKFRFFLLIGISILYLLSCSTSYCSAPAAVPDKHLKTVSLFDYLNTASARLDCYYTVEALNPTSEDAYNHAFVINDQTIKTVPLLIVYLRRQLHGINVFQDKRNMHIIHFADKNLPENYVMGYKASIRFAGKLGDLPDKLGQQLHLALFTQAVFSIPPPPHDHETNVNCVSDNESIRDILSNSVPLAIYNRYLWNSQATQGSAGLVTIVNYHGTINTAPH